MALIQGGLYVVACNPFPCGFLIVQYVRVEAKSAPSQDMAVLVENTAGIEREVAAGGDPAWIRTCDDGLARGTGGIVLDPPVVPQRLGRLQMNELTIVIGTHARRTRKITGGRRHAIGVD